MNIFGKKIKKKIIYRDYAIIILELDDIKIN
jgi:hypothetical protein